MHMDKSVLNLFKISKIFFYFTSLCMLALILIELDTLLTRLNDNDESMDLLASKVEYLGARLSNCYPND